MIKLENNEILELNDVNSTGRLIHRISFYIIPLSSFNLIVNDSTKP